MKKLDVNSRSRWKCTTCDKQFRDKTKCRLHILSVHIGEFSYRCRACDFKTKTEGQLVVHERRRHNILTERSKKLRGICDDDEDDDDVARNVVVGDLVPVKNE